MVTGEGRVRAIAPDGSRERSIRPFSVGSTTLAFGPESRRLAAAAGFHAKDNAYIRIWDLRSDETRDLRPDHGLWISRVLFTPDGAGLIESGLGGLAIWDLASGSRRQLHDQSTYDGQVGPGGDSVVFLEAVAHFQGTPRHIDLDSGDELPIGDFGVLGGLNVFRDGVLIGCRQDGTLVVGRLLEGRPHLLFGHKGTAFSVAKAGSRIVTGGAADGTLRIWPMPDVDETPFHLLPYDEILSRLRALTNVRVVPDEESETGYRTEHAEFPGWEEVPTW